MVTVIMASSPISGPDGGCYAAYSVFARINEYSLRYLVHIIDLVNAFFFIPVLRKDQKQLAFPWNRWKYNFAVWPEKLTFLPFVLK